MVCYLPVVSMCQGIESGSQFVGPSAHFGPFPLLLLPAQRFLLSPFSHQKKPGCRVWHIVWDTSEATARSQGGLPVNYFWYFIRYAVQFAKPTLCGAVYHNYCSSNQRVQRKPLIFFITSVIINHLYHSHSNTDGNFVTTLRDKHRL